MIPGMNVLDLGTGSGILSIAAIKLGAESVLALDIDPVAVKVAKVNAEKNGVGSKDKLPERNSGQQQNSTIQRVV